MNALHDFPADQFRIFGAFDHIDWLKRGKLADDMTIETLRERMSCQGCGGRECGIRIVYVGSGEFEYG